MSLSQSLKWINRLSTACVLTLLLLVGVAAHTIATAKIDLLRDIPLTGWYPGLVRNMAGIQFFEDNWWFTLPYLLLFYAILIYMEVRSTPPWAVWITFALLSVPIVAYCLTCVRIGTCAIFIMGPSSLH